MDIERCYAILQVGKSSTSEEITRSFRAMALKYHPDKNPHRRDWANEQMTTLNMAYSTLLSYRFRQENDESGVEKKASARSQEYAGGGYRNRREQEKRSGDELYGLRDDARKEYLINGFVRARESAKDSIYRYFQYSLYNFHRREENKNIRIYNDMVLHLRRTYHSIKKLSSMTDDPELIEHFDVFSRMIFNFYRASECLNLIDSYRDSYEVDSYRIYKQGDESLHLSHKEIFFDRHNRGFFIRERTVPPLLEAEGLFRRNLKLYSESSWAVETGIKLEYVLSLKAYIELFFAEE